MYTWNTPIRYAKGLGPVRSKELTKIGINTVGDLLERSPNHYLYPGGVSIAEAKEGYVVIKATIRTIERGPYQSTCVEAILNDATGTCTAMWWNGSYILQSLRPGMTVTFWGKYKGGVLQQPKWSTVPGAVEDVYGGQYGTHHATIRAALKEVLAYVELPELYDGQSTLDRVSVFEMFHFPADKTEANWALRDLKFDELLQMQLALAERRKGRERVTVEPMKWNNYLDRKIKQYFPYRRTFEQKRTMFTIVRELQRDVPMSRLLHGEVGVGKTAVAFYAAMLAALNGRRTLILCPTTILAAQHYDTLKGMGWDDVGLYSSGAYDVRSANIMIGTHALLNSEFLLKSASLVIIDEFQKFGVEQRAKIQRHNPHLLLLSATPIPRTLAATVFGDLDVSTIRQLPIVRGTIITRWVLPEKRESMYEIIEKELAKGKQAYFVYPRIDGEEQDGSAAAGFTQLCVSRFPDNKVRLLTGRYSAEDKAETLRVFRAGETDILVSTIIAEVGLDCPNASVMVIEGADRFGLSQLHQLRGRVCRSTDIAFCFLVSETANEKSIARLEVIERCNCGFEIAEADLRLRGPGELFSTRQSGLPDLKFASLLDDFDLMIEAKELAKTMPADAGVRDMMKLKYDGVLDLGGVV